MENIENIKKVVNVLSKYKNTDKFKIRIGKNGIGFSIHKDVDNELIKSDISKDEIREIGKTILDILSNRIIENKKPETEMEKYIIDKLYSNEFRAKYLLILTQTNLIFDDVEIISTLKEKDNTITSKTYTIKITTIDERGKPEIIKFECIKEDIEKIKKSLANI